MFDEEIKFQSLLSKLKKLFKGLKLSTGIYVLSFLFSGLLIVVAFIQFFHYSQNTTVAVCSVNPNSSALATAQIFVDVSGAVKNPGLYELAYGQRIAQAIEKTGGFSIAVDKHYIAHSLNLAKILEDGEKIYIPYQDELTTSDSQSANERVVNDNLISINTADLETLDTLPGIGEKRAETIVENRPYAQIDDLLEQEIISETLYREIEAFISI